MQINLPTYFLVPYTIYKPRLKKILLNNLLYYVMGILTFKNKPDRTFIFM